MEHLEEPLDASVLAIGAVHRNKGHVISAAYKAREKVPAREVKYVDRPKPRLQQRVMALIGGEHGDVPLVGPPPTDDDDPLVQQFMSVHQSSSGGRGPYARLSGGVSPS